MEGLLLKIRAVLNHNFTSSMKSEGWTRDKQEGIECCEGPILCKKRRKIVYGKKTVCVDIRRPVK